MIAEYIATSVVYFIMISLVLTKCVPDKIGKVILGVVFMLVYVIITCMFIAAHQAEQLNLM